MVRRLCCVRATAVHSRCHCWRSYVWSQQNQNIFRFGYNLQQQLITTEFEEEHSHVRKTFEDIATVQEYHQWLLGPMFATLFTSSSFDGGGIGIQGTVLASDYVVGGTCARSPTVDRCAHPWGCRLARCAHLAKPSGGTALYSVACFCEE